MSKKQIVVVAILTVIVAGGVWYFAFGKKTVKNNKQINVSKTESTAPANSGNVSPISGIACENWNRRPLAVMQPADVPARPAAGLSEADMIFEMPVITASITRLMGVYVCNTPAEVGSMRSSRHDYIALAKGLDAIYAHWGGSHYAIDLLNQNVIDDLNCNNDGGKSAGQCCFRKEGMARGVDSGYAKPEELLKCAKDFGYRLTDSFVGYPHQAEAAIDQRGKGGHLRVAFAGPYAAEYDYDQDSNTYKRTWGNVADTDRNNGQRIAPKNVVVMMAQSGQIVEGEQYNNVQIGDPWYDSTDTGEAIYYMNGQEIKGNWKKDKSKAESKLFFYDESGQEVKFVPGQIWVEILEPGQALKWEPIL
ncbi:MAG: DUF3048 domain-containing protein [Parcubacteria group bacterium]|jgi:hypothetical protein